MRQPRRSDGPWSRRRKPVEAPPQRVPQAPARPTRAELLEQLAAARAAGDRTRVSEALGKLMLTPHDRPPRGTADNGRS